MEKQYVVSDHTMAVEIEADTPEEAAEFYFDDYDWASGEKSQPYYVRDDAGNIVLRGVWVEGG